MLCYQDDGTFAVDNSARSTFHECQLQWWLRVYLGRSTSERKKDLYCGTCLHVAMEQFYKGVDPIEIMATFDATYGEWARGKVDVKDGKSWQNIREVLWVVLQRRLTAPPYQPVPDFVEFPIEYTFDGVKYCGKLDAVVEAAHGYGIEDTKSTGRPDKGWEAQFEMCDALTGYYDGMREQHNTDIPNCYINVIHSKALPANMEASCTQHSRGKQKVKWGECWPQHNESRVIGPFLRDPHEIPAFRQRVVSDVESMKRVIDVAPTIHEIDKVEATGKVKPRTACEWCEFRPYCLGGTPRAETIMANTVEVYFDPREENV